MLYLSFKRGIEGSNSAQEGTCEPAVRFGSGCLSLSKGHFHQNIRGHQGLTEVMTSVDSLKFQAGSVMLKMNVTLDASMLITLKSYISGGGLDAANCLRLRK